MSVAELRQQLHAAIDNIDNREYLEAMLTIIGSQMREDEPLTEEQIRILKEREAKYLSGEAKTVTLDELKARMKEKYGF